MPPIDDNDMKRLYEVFMPRSECTTQMTGVHAEIADLKQQLAVISTRLGLVLGILGTIGAAIVAVLAKLFFVK